MDASFTKKLRIQMRLVNRELGEIKEQEIYVGDIPIMTDRGTFIINGAERVIVSQIVRSPGIYYKREVDTNGKRTFSATLIPNRGAWLKFETDTNDVIYVKIDKNRKLLATTLIRALGYSDAEMEGLFRHRVDTLLIPMHFPAEKRFRFRIGLLLVLLPIGNKGQHLHMLRGRRG